MHTDCAHTAVPVRCSSTKLNVQTWPVTRTHSLRKTMLPGVFTVENMKKRFISNRGETVGEKQ